MIRIARFANAVWRYYVSALSTHSGAEYGDTPIVPGQDTTQPDMLGSGSYWRSFYAVLVWCGSHFHRVIVTGRTAAPPMRDPMVNRGVPRDAIMVEDSATSTRENAQYVARLLDRNTGRCVLLTSDYHMRRAARIPKGGSNGESPRHRGRV